MSLHMLRKARLAAGAARIAVTCFCPTGYKACVGHETRIGCSPSVETLLWLLPHRLACLVRYQRQLGLSAAVELRVPPHTLRTSHTVGSGMCWCWAIAYLSLHPMLGLPPTPSL